MRFKKILSLLLAMTMLFSCVGITAMAEETPEKGYILTVYSEGDPFVIDAEKSASAFNLKTALEDAYVFIDNPWMSGVSGTPSIVIDMYEDSQYAEMVELKYATTINGNGHKITYTGEGNAYTGIAPTLNDVTFANENETETQPTAVGNYDELVAALANGGEIILNDNITTEAAIVTSGITATINLNGNTLKIGAGDNKFNDESNITIKNGNIDIDGVDVGGNAIFCLDEYEKTLVTTLTLEDVNLTGDGYDSAYGVFYIGSSSVLNVNGGVWNLSNDTHTSGGVFKADDSNATLNITGTDMTLHNVRRVVTYAATEIKDSTITVTGDADGVDAEMEHGFNRSPLVIDNSTITMTDMVGRGITAQNGAVEIKNGSTVTITNAQEATIDVRDGQTVTISEDSTVTVDAAPIISSGKIDGDIEKSPAGPVEVDTYEKLVEALEVDNANIIMTADITATATQNSGYGKAGIVLDAGDVLDGNGKTLTINDANSTWDCVIAMRGGEVKNLTIAGSMRGVFMPGANGDVVINNCVFKDVIYTFNSDAGSKDYSVTIKNTTLNGWTSFSNVHKSVTFESCEFGEGSGYAFCRPYNNAEFVKCEFNAGFEVDAIRTATPLAFNDCTYAGETLTAENGGNMFGAGSVVIDGETVSFNRVAQIGETTYTSVQDAIAAAVDGDTITLIDDVTITETVIVDKDITLDLNEKTVINKSKDSNTFRIAADVTVKNGTVKNGNKADNEGGGYTFIVGYNTPQAGNLTIESGSYYGRTTVISVTYGTATINGGYFEATEYNGEYDFTINCIDRFYASGDAKVIVNGGKFYKFNPSNNKAEGTDTDFCAENHIGLPNLDGEYIVGVKPTATVDNLGSAVVRAGDYYNYGGGGNAVDMPLSFVMQFVADETAEAGAASPYAEWYADFTISVTGLKDGYFVADGCYLAGNYGSFGWWKVPIDGLKVEDGVVYPVMLSVANGAQLYEYICSGVENFKCAMYLTPEVLEANPDLEVTLSLVLVDSSKGADGAIEAITTEENCYVVEKTTYDNEEFMIEYVAEINGVKYLSLQDAIDEAEDGDTVTLISNVEMTNSVVISGKTLTLDLGEYTIYDKNTTVLTESDDIWGLIALENSAKLTICGNGTIECNYAVKGNGWTGMAFAIDVDATSELTVNSGNITNGNGGIQTCGKVTVNNGTFVSHNGGTCIMALNSSAYVTVNGGVFKDSVGENDVYTGSGAVWAGFEATVNINGGTYDFAADPEHDNIVWTLFPAQNAISGYGKNANMTVAGGTFANFNPATDAVVDYSPSTGFTFGSVVAEDYEVVQNADGTYGVEKSAAGTIRYRAYVNDADDREGVGVDLADIYAKESLVIKLFDAEGNLLTTTTLKAGGVEATEYSCNIVLWGRASSSWETVINAEELTVSNMPEIIELWCDGKLVDTYENALGAGTHVDEVNDYIALDCIPDPVATVTDSEGKMKLYDALDKALAAAEADDTITLLEDIELEEGITIPADKTITLDLAGYTITGAPAESAAYAVITNKGNLTVEDSVGGGKILCDHQITGSTSYAVNTITNAGTLTVNGGVIENTSTASNQIGYAIDNNSTTGNAVVTVNGGEIKASGSNYYDGIRQFCNSTTLENSVIVNDGSVSSIWMQNPSDGASDKNTKDVKGSVTVNGGTVTALYLEPSASFEAAVTGGNIGTLAHFQKSEGRDLAGFVSGGTFTNKPEDVFAIDGFEFKQNADGTYGVKKVELFDLYAANVTLGNSLAMNFAINMSDIMGTDYYAEIKHYAESEVKTIKVDFADWTIDSTGKYYVVTYSGLTAKQIVDDLEVTIYRNDDTQVSNVWEDGLKAYALRMMEKTLDKASLTEKDNELLIVLADMLNYGAAAQREFSYKVDTLATDGVDEKYMAYASEMPEISDVSERDSEICFGSTLSLKDSIVLKAAFKGVSEGMYATVSFTKHNGKTDFFETITYADMEKSGSYVIINVDDLVIADAKQVVTITIYDVDGNVYTVFKDSMNSYIKRNIDDGDASRILEMTAKFTSSAYNTLH